MATAAPVKFPKTLGACADRVYELRAKRLAAQKDVDAIEAEEKALKEHIINTLPKSETTGVAGKVARVTVVTKQVPPGLHLTDRVILSLRKTLQMARLPHRPSFSLRRLMV